MKQFKTFAQKPAEVSRKWILLDAASAPLGRLSTLAATYLIGKDKPDYTPHVDGGDYVVIVNAAHLKVTGNKETDKLYYRYSGYPGGIKSDSLAVLRKEAPEKIIEHAVRGMLPKNKLAEGRMARLKVYSGPEHHHEAQKPEKVEVK